MTHEKRLEIAKKNYPIGTKFKSIINRREYIVYTNSHCLKNRGNIDVDEVPWLYYNGVWAEIISPVSETENYQIY